MLEAVLQEMKNSNKNTKLLRKQIFSLVTGYQNLSESWPGGLMENIAIPNLEFRHRVEYNIMVHFTPC